MRLTKEDQFKMTTISPFYTDDHNKSIQYRWHTTPLIDCRS